MSEDKKNAAAKNATQTAGGKKRRNLIRLGRLPMGGSSFMCIGSMHMKKRPEGMDDADYEEFKSTSSILVVDDVLAGTGAVPSANRIFGLCSGDEKPLILPVNNDRKGKPYAVLIEKGSTHKRVAAAKARLASRGAATAVGLFIVTVDKEAGVASLRLVTEGDKTIPKGTVPLGVTPNGSPRLLVIGGADVTLTKMMADLVNTGTGMDYSDPENHEVEGVTTHDLREMVQDLSDPKLVKKDILRKWFKRPERRRHDRVTKAHLFRIPEHLFPTLK